MQERSELDTSQSGLQRRASERFFSGNIRLDVDFTGGQISGSGDGLAITGRFSTADGRGATTGTFDYSSPRLGTVSGRMEGDLADTVFHGAFAGATSRGGVAGQIQARD